VGLTQNAAMAEQGLPLFKKGPKLFISAEEAWFWFVTAQLAAADGARIKAGAGSSARPCEPVDIYTILDKLYRNRRLLIDHIHVMRHYGRRMFAPDPKRLKELRAHRLWCEAMERMEEVMIRKGIVEAKPIQRWI
jgi:hypothetical protein